MSLEQLGWNRNFAAEFKKLGGAELKPARVTGTRKNSFVVSDGEGEMLVGVMGRVRSGSLYPAAGDWVALKGNAIAAVLPRFNALSRGASGSRGKLDAPARMGQVIAANIDTVFIVCGLDRDYNLRRIERYITLIYGCGCLPAVILNKADLQERAADFVQEVEAVAFGVPVHTLSAREGAGLEQLSAYLMPGRTVALLGSSGAGKSTLVNRLAGAEIRQTREVSDAVGKGVHVTTTRDLIVLPGGGMLIDNPGIREIALFDDEGGIGAAFPDIEAWSRECRFSDCGHRHEPGCRVLRALEDGELDPGRYESYVKLASELEYLAQRETKSADRIEKEKWKKIAGEIRRLKID